MPKGAKVVSATADELDEAKDTLRGEIAAAREAYRPALDACENKLRGELQGLADSVTKNASASQAAVGRVAQDAKGYTEASVEKLETKLTNLLPPIREKIEQVEQDLGANIKNVQTDIRQTLKDELAALSERFNRDLALFREEVSSTMEARAKDTSDALAKQRESSDISIEALRQEVKAHDAEMKKAMNKELQDVVAAQKKVDQTQDDRNEGAQNEIFLKIERLDDAIKELTESTTENTTSVQQSAAADIATLRADVEPRLDSLDNEGGKLRDAMCEVENFSTRRVDWIIRNVSQRLKPSTERTSLHTSWFSPKFNAAGAHGLQLELQLFRLSDPPIDGDMAGDCAIFLWACKGMNLVFKLYIGSKSVTLEKIFNGRVPYGTQRLCFLKDHVNKHEDSVRISVEILEAVREVEHPIKVPVEDEEASGKGVGKAGGGDATSKPLEGLILFRRHINNRILDQVKSEVDMMRSRMVRNIEWRVEQASLLRRCFPQGEPICSMPFNAAGVEGLQLVFYPSGYAGSTDGFCSLFLFAPAGATLRCWLWAGNQKREASHSFEKPGAFGRTNFCRFESVLDDAEDVVVVALEIEEAHQDVQAHVAHPVVQPGDKRTQAQLDASMPTAVESVVKLQRAPGRPVPGLEDKRVLPSLWTAKSLGDRNSAPDGLHSFNEIGSRGKCAGNWTTSVESPGRGNGGARRCDSMPSLDRTAMQCNDTVPLPKLAKSHGGGWDNECSGSDGGGRLRKVRSGRRMRGNMASTTPSLNTMSSDVVT